MQTESLNTNVPIAGSTSPSEHRFPWKWNLADLKDRPKNGKKVFSCFSCGGGSSMGYKLAGYDLIGNVEIDPAIIELYRKNHHPKYSYLLDVRDFCAIPDDELPPELFDLDILDGSPPCSVFSMVGMRVKDAAEDRGTGLNRKKKFREGQKEQRLDDLFFWFIKIAAKLKPRVVIAENVIGLLRGTVKGYVNEIIKAFDEAGYIVQLFHLNAAKMGVPQARERVFFICRRKDLFRDVAKLVLDFNEPPIRFNDVRTEKGKPLNPDSMEARLLSRRKPGDRLLSDVSERLRGKRIGFSMSIVSDDRVCCTVTSSGSFYRMIDGMKFSDQDFINCQSFPQDYDFGKQSVQYVCGMSVPPVMMAQISAQIYEQWLSKL